MRQNKEVHYLKNSQQTQPLALTHTMSFNVRMFLQPQSLPGHR